MKRKLLNLALVLLFATAILMPTSNNVAVADELGYASEQQQTRGIFDILKTSISLQMGMSTSALAVTPPAGTFISWSVTDPLIASVSSDGTVKGLRFGKTQLVAVISIPGVTTATRTTNINVTLDSFLFYIKNKNSGQYLSVYNSLDAENQSVVQAKHTDVSYTAMLWELTRHDDETFTIKSKRGTSNRVLTIDLAGSAGTQNALYAKIATDTGGTNQRFKLILNDDNTTYRIVTMCSSQSKCLSVINASCDSNASVFQYTYGTAMNDEWLLIPFGYNGHYVTNYARSNALTSTGISISGMYPYFIDADCANFVSQCLVAGGIRFVDEWFIYRNNSSAAVLMDFVNNPNDISLLNSGWDFDTIGNILNQSSPWISAPQFYNFWDERVSTYQCTGQYILDNPSILSRYYVGDVVQYAVTNNNNLSIKHTMIVTERESNDLFVSYHSGDHFNRSLIDLIYSDSKYRTYTFIFFTFT